jgi:hypothetical protein
LAFNLAFNLALNLSLNLSSTNLWLKSIGFIGWIDLFVFCSNVTKHVSVMA